MPLFIRHLPKDDTKRLNFTGFVMVAAVSFCIVSSLQPRQATASSPDAPGGSSAPVPLEAEEEPTRGSVVNIIVIGGTGDLSTRYLWQGFFNLINEEKNQAFHLYAGSRMLQEDGEKEMKLILERNVSCSKVPASVAMTPEECERAKEVYKEKVTYHMLKKPEDYVVLCSNIQHTMRSVGLKEAGRIFYFSVPAFAYEGIAENINKVCRPAGDAWLRAVLEKPFGHDTASAKKLSSALKEHLAENEIYRIDHYLGKTGVQSILPFRALNEKNYGGIWNSENIERVEIVMKESLDSKGRIYFYDKYGVMRDVMQNHLTEIMALVAMEIPSNLSSIHDYQREKLALLSQVDHVTAEQAAIGQYESYVDEWREEMDKGEDDTSSVPTFAGVLFFVSSPRWKDVPFLMLSGKKLDEKQTYVRIVFKNSHFCTVTPNYAEGDHACRQKQIIFFIGSGNHPTIAVSRALRKPQVPKSWSIPDLDPDTNILGSPVKDFYAYSAGVELDAYSVLIKECYHGNRDKFIGSSELVASWDIWTPLLRALEDVPPMRYPGGKETGRWLDMEIQGRRLRSCHKNDRTWNIEDSNRFGMPSISGIPDTFRSNNLYTGSKEDTVSLLAKHLLVATQSAISSHGAFHVAFPGGNTPEMLFLHLFLRMRHTFPWRETHVWLTDERCVPLDSELSNFNVIYSKLLRYIPIPYTNIHPMPVQLAHGLCNLKDGGPELYSAEIKRLIPDQRFDFVVLGVGEDGHVASLFPHHEILVDKTNFVLFSDGAVQSSSPRRMTLGYSTINNSRNVAILITGERKRFLVEKLKQTHFKNATEFPVLGVAPNNGTLSWFIDHDALV
ncbi:GDH/6PGL endoplasmic bifunctional protein isoform X1 [Strongylocentrotus purpuratus]|uniref:Glucose-6-phosphate 1-dehydrogenase n=1 Tax=Strongylocentrotus purpuratus TaxID=7668 RepID=A0A7M7REP7_STRPU|nr:GDH/6PGL endoplasmic bifunctional protein isoform X1 [Strongylocentrotus purpuratus]